MSLRTCSWLLPQNEHRYGTLGPLVLLVDVTRAVLSSRLSPLLLDLLGSRRLRGHVLGVGHGRPLATGDSGVVGLGDQRFPWHRVDSVDDAIVLRLVGRHEIVPIRVLLDLVERLARVLGEEL